MLTPPASVSEAASHPSLVTARTVADDLSSAVEKSGGVYEEADRIFCRKTLQQCFTERFRRVLDGIEFCRETLIDIHNYSQK